MKDTIVSKPLHKQNDKLISGCISIYQIWNSATVKPYFSSAATFYTANEKLLHSRAPGTRRSQTRKWPRRKTPFRRRALGLTNKKKGPHVCHCHIIESIIWQSAQAVFMFDSIFRFLHFLVLFPLQTSAYDTLKIFRFPTPKINGSLFILILRIHPLSG